MSDDQRSARPAAPRPLIIPETLEYPTRILTFLDVLGFSADVTLIDEDPHLIESIGALLARLSKCRQDLIDQKAHELPSQMRMTTISDSVVLSYAPVPLAAFRALDHAANIAQILMSGGYLARGAIVLGRAQHTDTHLFGEALIKAHTIELKLVHTPRIVVAPEVLSMCEVDLAGRDRFEFLKRGTDFTWVHVLGKGWRFLRREKVDDMLLGRPPDRVEQMYEELQLSIPLRWQRAANLQDPVQREKARSYGSWMADYVNASIGEQGLDERLKIKLPSDA